MKLLFLCEQCLILFVKLIHGNKTIFDLIWRRQTQKRVHTGLMELFCNHYIKNLILLFAKCCIAVLKTNAKFLLFSFSNFFKIFVFKLILLITVPNKLHKLSSVYCVKLKIYHHNCKGFYTSVYPNMFTPKDILFLPTLL